MIIFSGSAIEDELLEGSETFPSLALPSLPDKSSSEVLPSLPVSSSEFSSSWESIDIDKALTT